MRYYPIVEIEMVLIQPGYSKSFRFLKNYKIPLICEIGITLLKVVIQKMLFQFYHLIIIMKIANFRLFFSTIAYVLVLSIIPWFIGICLFPSINPVSNEKIL
jgi:hypothetical protein